MLQVDEDGMLPPIQPEGDEGAPRLVRVSRLYSALGRLASGTTSLCTLE
jgi:hypothetical protein